MPGSRLVAPQHTLHQIPQRAPEIFTPARQPMLINKQHIMLKACIEMRLKTQLNNDRVVVAVNVRVDAVQALEHVADEGGKGLGKGHADTRGKHGFVVDVGLHPGHEVFDVLGRRHLGGLFEGFRVLPEVFESVYC
jgi:hypothetical protein